MSDRDATIQELHDEDCFACHHDTICCIRKAIERAYAAGEAAGRAAGAEEERDALYDAGLLVARGQEPGDE